MNQQGSPPRLALALSGLLLAGSAAHAQFGDLAAEAGDRFGEVVARGDFNGDTYQDLAVGVPWEGLGGGAVPNAGAVEVIYGGAGGLGPAQRQFWSQDSAGVEDAAESGDFFGDSLAAGDFNGDSRADLAIGAIGEDVGSIREAGAVNVTYGSAAGLSATAIPDQLWHQDSTSVLDVAEADPRGRRGARRPLRLAVDPRRFQRRRLRRSGGRRASGGRRRGVGCGHRQRALRIGPGAGRRDADR
jgi:hypothetical protein